MFSEYIAASLDRAQYETLEDGTYVATVDGLRGVWATGKTIEECCKDLMSVIEGWIVVRLRLGTAHTAYGRTRNYIVCGACIHIR